MTNIRKHGKIFELKSVDSRQSQDVKSNRGCKLVVITMALCVYDKEPFLFNKVEKAHSNVLSILEVKQKMPSAKVLEAKKAQVAEVVEILKAAQTGVIVDYRGLNVEEDTQLRNKLREANVKYFVIKNTLLFRAAKELGLDALEEVLHGPTALAVSTEDAVAPAKVLADFAKSNEKLELKAGFMDGAVMSLDEVKKLAATPNRETLLAKMLGSINAPISNLARTLQAIVDGGVEISDLVAKESADSAEEAVAEAPAEEAPAAEEVVAEAATEEAPAEEAAEAPAEEAPAAEESDAE